MWSVISQVFILFLASISHLITVEAASSDTLSSGSRKTAHRTTHKKKKGKTHELRYSTDKFLATVQQTLEPSLIEVQNKVAVVNVTMPNRHNTGNAKSFLDSGPSEINQDWFMNVVVGSEKNYFFAYDIVTAPDGSGENKQLFYRFPLSNCAGRWFAFLTADDTTRAMGVGDGPGGPDDIEANCENIKAEIDKVQGISECATEEQFWGSECVEKVRAELGDGAKTFQLPTWKTDWELDETPAPKCGAEVVTIKHYLNKEQYTVLVPTKEFAQTTPILTPPDNAETWENKGGACAGKTAGDCILADNMVIVQGGGRSATPFFADDAWMSKYVNCRPEAQDQAKIKEILALR